MNRKSLADLFASMELDSAVSTGFKGSDALSQGLLRSIRAVVFDVDGVLSANTVSLGADGNPVRTVNIKDGYAIQHARKMGLEVVILTGGDTLPVRRRFENLGLHYVYMGCRYKLDVFHRFLDESGYRASEVAFMGDDIPDYEAMCEAGLPCCPADAAPEIKSISRYVSPFAGGQGCGRDVLERLLKARNAWMNGREAFTW